MPEQKKTSNLIVFTIISVGLLMLWFTIGGCRHSSIEKRLADIEYTDNTTIRVLLKDSAEQIKIKLSNSGKIASEKYISIPLRPSANEIGFYLNNTSIICSGKNLGNSAEIIPDNGSFISVDGKSYRGHIRLEARDNGVLRVINVLPLEAYLGGVIAAEMPASWNKEALKAQTVVARTYSLYIMERFGKNRGWDVKSTQANQVYKGIQAETEQTWDAIKQTQGFVLTCGQSDNPKGLFPTYYCSVCGGHTENSKNVFNDSYEPLQGVKCDFCKNVAGKSFYSWKKQKINTAIITKLLIARYPAISELKNISIAPVEISEYDTFQRITKYKISGDNGNYNTLTGEDFRLSIDSNGLTLKSAACKVTQSGNYMEFSDGRGFGHGVGLCQYGALGMARENKTFEDILTYYFPGSQLERLYN